MEALPDKTEHDPGPIPHAHVVGTDIPVLISFYDGRVSSGAMEVRLVGFGLRAWRAGRALGICWAFALIAVLVPFLHWVLVPALILLGPVVALRAFANDRQVSGGGGPCPVCASVLTFARSAKPEAFQQTCPGCRLSLQVALKPTLDRSAGWRPRR